MLEVPPSRGREVTPIPQNEGRKQNEGDIGKESDIGNEELQKFIQISTKQSKRRPKPPQEKDFMQGDKWQTACQDVVLLVYYC